MVFWVLVSSRNNLEAIISRPIFWMALRSKYCLLLYMLYIQGSIMPYTLMLIVRQSVQVLFDVNVIFREGKVFNSRLMLC